VQPARGFSALCTAHAPKPMARGVAIEACVPIPQVLWLLSSKESNNKKNLRGNTVLRLRHGMDRDAPVLGWVAGRESRTTPVARWTPVRCFFSSTKLHEGHEEGMRRFGFFASFRMTVRVWRSVLCCRELTDTLAVSSAVTAAAHDGEVPTGLLRTASSGRKCSSQNSFVPRRLCLPSHPPPLRQVPAAVS
jgi:hypothetical protein